jgi:hypothetical protein
MIGLFLAVSLIPLALVGALSYWSAISAPKKVEFEKLHEAADIRKAEILAYLNHTMTDIKFLASLDPLVQSAKQMQSLASGKPKTVVDGPAEVSLEDYRKVFKDIDPIIRKFFEIVGNESSGYDDIYMIDGLSGVILYTFQRQADLGSNLRNGPYRESGLAKVLEKVSRTKKPATIDFAAYGPTGLPLMFVATPCVFDPDGNVK